MQGRPLIGINGNSETADKLEPKLQTQFWSPIEEIAPTTLHIATTIERCVLVADTSQDKQKPVYRKPFGEPP